LHPFDIKAALVAKHAQHVVLIHFPIALFIAGVAFDFVAQWTKQRILAAAAYCNLVAAAAVTVPVLITGILGVRCWRARDVCVSTQHASRPSFSSI